MFNLYESHLGGYYIITEPIPKDIEYCDQCGDSDWLLGIFNTKEEAEKYQEQYEKHAHEYDYNKND